jgi:hypothetical protein
MNYPKYLYEKKVKAGFIKTTVIGICTTVIGI